MSAPQPFKCPVSGCPIACATAKALEQHLQDRHEPKWTMNDRRLLKEMRIKVEE